MSGAWRTAEASSPSIALKEHGFVGEDPVLMGELRRRAAAAPALNLTFGPPPTRELFQPDFQQLAREASSALMNETRRQGFYPREPGEADLKDHAISMMEHTCYAVQYRLKEVDSAVKKYSNDPRFRIAYTFKQLEDWEHEITMLYSYAKHDKRKELMHFRIYRQIVYYSHAVRKMIDVTYTAEYLINLHERFEEAFNSLE